MGAQLVAQAADGLAQAAFAHDLVLEPRGTPVRILAVFALTLVPYSLIAPFTGVLIDRWSRRAILVWSNAARALLLMTLPLWAARLQGDLGLYGAALALLGLGRLFLTTKGAVLPVVLHERGLVAGNALSGGGGMIAALLGGLAGVGALALLPPAGAYVVSGCAYGLAAVVARALPAELSRPPARRPPVGREVARVARELLEGLRAVAVRPAARLPLGGIFVLRVGAMVVAIAAIEEIKVSYEAGGARLGPSALALGAAGAGALAGAAAAPPLGRRLPKPAMLLFGFVVSGIVMVATAPFQGMPTLLVLTFVSGLGAFVAKVATDASVQEALPDHYRGRAFALYDILYNLASVVAAALMVVFAATPLAARLAGGGALVLLLAVALAGAMRSAGLLGTPPAAPARR